MRRKEPLEKVLVNDNVCVLYVHCYLEFEHVLTLISAILTEVSYIGFKCLIELCVKVAMGTECMNVCFENFFYSQISSYEKVPRISKNMFWLPTEIGIVCWGGIAHVQMC